MTEFSAQKSTSHSPRYIMPEKKFVAADFTEWLKTYYSLHFPYQLIEAWLNYKEDDTNVFKFREFSFTLPGDIYIRYMSFEDGYDLKRSLIHKLPIKIDAGAVYNINPRLHKSFPTGFIPQQRELIFDIDISDYNDVRTCCQESNICQKCWPFMSIGAKVLHTILTKEFGFKHLLFVFSGRRGFHCWVCDREARLLTSEARRAIADYFSVIKGGDNIVRRVELEPTKGLHPMILKSLEVIDENFEELMVDQQDFLANDHLIQNVVDLCQEDRELQDRLRDQCRVYRNSSKECWTAIKMVCESHKKRGRYNYFLQEVKLHHCFPRLDANVTRGMNHLLKMPFCIHPKTGSVCVPIAIEDIDKFKLSAVPNVEGLTKESLDPYLKVFKNFCESLQNPKLQNKSKKVSNLEF